MIPRLLLILGLTVLPGSATWTLIQHPVTSSNCTTAICTVTLTQNTGAAHLLFISSTYRAASQITISSISGGGIYTIPALCQFFIASPAQGVNCAYTLATTSGAGSISITQSGAAASGADFSVREYSTSPGFAPAFDTSGGPTNAGACTNCSGAGLLLSGIFNDVIIQWIAVTGTSVTGVSSYTTFDTDSNGSGYANLLNVSSFPPTPTWTNTAATGAIVTGLAFAEVAVPGGPGSKGNKLRKLTDDF